MVRHHSSSSPKIALVHDYLKEYGGAESVLEALSDIYPDADIFTSLYRPTFFGPHQKRLEKKWQGRIHQSFFSLFPFAHKIISPLRLLSPFAFKSFDFSDYDIIITSATGAYFPNLLNKKNATLICYCHTPPRYLYGLPTARNYTNNRYIAFFVNFLNHFLRLLDFKSAQNVDHFIANSLTTSKRIQKFYRRVSVIINPPVTLPPKFDGKIIRSDFYVTGGRLARAKRYDIPILACSQKKYKLKVFGRDFAGYLEELKNIASPEIEFLGEITESQKFTLLSQAKGYIFASDNEDFGIAPVEAMAYGCPVIAYKSGGVVETVIDGKTGYFFKDLTTDSCIQAIKKLEKSPLNPSDCYLQAKHFSKKVFVDKIKSFVSEAKP